jgi:Protein of unknown function (DUF3515)
MDPIRRRGALVATAVALPVTALLALALHRPAAPPATVTPATASPTALGPVTVDAPTPSATAGRDCPAVISHLPAALAGKPARQARSKSSPYVASWGDPPLILRCGVPRPAGYTGGSELTVVDGVQWLPDKRGTETVWTAVDRGSYVELTIPGGFTGTAVVELSQALSQALPARPLDPGP